MFELFVPPIEIYWKWYNRVILEDLYYRLAVGMIEIPPLREGGDIAILAKDLLSNINLELVSDSFTKKL